MEIRLLENKVIAYLDTLLAFLGVNITSDKLIKH